MAMPSHDVICYLRSLLHHHSDAAESDRELLRRFVERHDDDAFTALLRRHGPMVLNLARRITGDKQLAEDVFQATFLLLSQKGGTIRRPEALPCWLHGVARRLAVQTRSTQLRCQRQELRCRPSLLSNPLDELTAQEFLSVLDEELMKLPEKYRAPLILCCLEGLSQEEAARHLSCSADAVRGRLERGRQRLRLRLETRGMTLPAALGGILLITGATRTLPAALTRSTLQAATTGSGVTPAIAALMKGATQTMFLHKLKLAGAAIVLLVAAGGFSMVMLPEKEPPEQPSISAVIPEKPALQGDHRDFYGDPLPKGAIMRLGTLQRRAVGARLAVSSDGQSILGVRGRKYLHIWDAATGKLRQTRELPGQGIAAVVLSPDGKMLAAAEGNEKLAVWDVPTGKRLQTLILKGATAEWCIPLIAFSADGKQIAAVGQRQEGQDGGSRHDDLVRVWELSSGKEIFRRDIRNNNQRYLLTFSPDGQRLLASFNNSQGTYCCCWDIANGQQVWQSKDNIWGYSLVFTPDGKVLASQQPSLKKLVAVDLATGQMIPMEKTPPIDHDTRLTLTPDGRKLLISTAEGAVVWDMVQDKELRTLLGAGEEIAMMPDGKSIITNNGSLQRWDLATGQPLWTDTFAFGHIGEVVSIAFSADGTRLVSAARDGSVRLWDTTTGKPLRIWRGHQPQRPTITTSAWMAAGVKTVDITPDGRRVLSAASDENIKLWDTAVEKEVCSLALPKREKGEGDRSVFQVRISGDGAKAVALFGSWGFVPKLAAWDLKTGELLASHPIALKQLALKQPIEIMQAQFSRLAPDGRTWLVNGILVDAMSSQEIAQFEGMKASPQAFSRDGLLVAGAIPRPARKNGQMNYMMADDIRVWEAATGKPVAQLKTPFLSGLLEFHPSNRFLATSNWDGIQLWDLVTGKVVATRQMPERIRSNTAQASYASCLAFAPDRRLATGHPDGTILLWDKPLPASKPQTLTTRELEMLWDDLADADAGKAWRAVWRLADAPNDGLALLRGRVKPYPTASAEVTRKLFADLDSDSFKIREAAERQLKELGLQAEPALRVALQANLSLEQRRRIESILARLSGMPEKPSPEDLRQLRALIVLERIGLPEARLLLEEVAKGPESARLTRQARAALARLP